MPPLKINILPNRNLKHLFIKDYAFHAIPQLITKEGKINHTILQQNPFYSLINTNLLIIQ